MSKERPRLNGLISNQTAPKTQQTACLMPATKNVEYGKRFAQSRELSSMIYVQINYERVQILYFS